jgi:hypothetical protein
LQTKQELIHQATAIHAHNMLAVASKLCSSQCDTFIKGWDMWPRLDAVSATLRLEQDLFLSNLHVMSLSYAADAQALGVTTALPCQGNRGPKNLDTTYFAGQTADTTELRQQPERGRFKVHSMSATNVTVSLHPRVCTAATAMHGQHYKCSPTPPATQAGS